MTDVDDLNSLASELRSMRGQFIEGNGELFLDTHDEARFSALEAEARTILGDALGATNAFSVGIIFAVGNGTGGFMGGPSLACVSEVEAQIRSGIRMIERKQRTAPLEAARTATKPPYVNAMRIYQLQGLQSQWWDYSKLIRLCNELNTNNEHECHYGVAMLLRAITDHVPPLFGFDKFAHVIANYKSTKSFKEAMVHLDTGLRKIADSFLHEQIRRREATPNATQVDFSQTLDLLLAEVIRVGDGQP